ncbi:MAG: hypothetical protein AABO58_13310 [Acidobacteriota bacterium]
MKRLLIAVLLIATPLQADDCSLLRELYGVRATALKSSYDVDRHIDRRLDALREGWVRWVRPVGEGPFDKKLHRTKAPKSAPDSFEASGEHAYAVRVTVPAKRTVFYGNNPVYVGSVEIRYEADGKTKTMTQKIDALMQPDTSRTIELPVIADRVDVRLASGTDKPGESLVEVHFKQAVAEDDPANPDYAAVRALQRIRSSSDPRDIDDEIAEMERRIFPDSDPLPLLEILADLRRADDLIRSKNDDDQERGNKLLRDTLRRLR